MEFVEEGGYACGLMIRVLDGNEGLDEAPSGSDLVRVAQDVFGPGGLMEAGLGLEHRTEQFRMAEAVGRALSEGESLLFEAGTGVGKSLAYLVPGLIKAVEENRPFVVATNTIILQEQLLEKDIPMARKIFEKSPDLAPMADFRAALLVGKANYLCDNRLASTLAGQGELFETEQRVELERIRDWLTSAPKEGIRQELSPPPKPEVWDAVNADCSLCSNKRCSPKTCCYRRAKARMDEAHLLVLNHSLLFALVGVGAAPGGDDPGVLFPKDFVVFDEAHEVPAVASDHLGMGMSSWALSLAFSRLYNPGKKRGLLRKIAKPQDFELVENARFACEDFFNHVHVSLLPTRDVRRITEPGNFPAEVFPPMSLLLRRLKELAESTEDEYLRAELKDQIKRFDCYLRGMAEITELKDADKVYWVERTGKRKSNVHLRSSPLDVAEALRDILFARGTSVVMTSATLTRRGSADTFRASVGAEHAAEGVVASPFDFEKNVTIHVAADCPEPMGKERLPYLHYLVEALHFFARRVTGGTLALFTNYADLRHCHDVLRPRWRKLERPLYAQGEGFSRSELRERLMRDGNALLLGAESFWKGFDAPGPALSQVILTRLPFENPGHPALEARAEKLESEGKNSFREMTLPTAVIRFRQGIGRLVRRSEDCGDLVVLDSRVLRKSYGKDFLTEFPKADYQVFHLPEDLRGATDSGKAI